MMKRNLLWCIALVATLVFGGLAVAQRPVANIDAKQHPNLAAAQEHISQAFQRIEEARTVNHEELGGHAEKANQLLVQADQELKAAAEYANHHK